MTLFDLLFLTVVLASVLVLVAVVVLALSGRRRQAAWMLGGYGICLALYLGVVAAVSLASPQRVLARGEDRCYDDWCIAVIDATRVERPEVARYVVLLRVTNRARGVSQRENGMVAYVLDEQGRRFDPTPDPAQAPFDTLLEPGRSVATIRTFNVAGAVGLPVLVLEHGGASRFPGLVIIGDESSLLHKPMVVRLP
jgi:hypothetical protein